MSAPVKKCEVCDDTGSKSRDMGGDMDCTACNATTERMVMRIKLGLTWGDDDAWRAYQLGKAAAAPVATRNVLADELLAALDEMKAGDADKAWAGWERCDTGDEVGSRLDAAIAAYRAAPVVPVAAQPTLNETWVEAIEAAAKTAESHQLAEKLARMTMSNPVGHALNLTRTIAAAIRSIAARVTAAQPVVQTAIDWKDRLYVAMDAEFALREGPERDEDGQRMGIVIDDTQVGVEFAMSWFEQNMLAAPSLEAQPAGEVEAALKIARAALHTAEYAIKGREHTGFITNAIAVIDAAMAQGEKQ